MNSTYKPGRLLCELGWHRRPFEHEPAPTGMTPEEYQFNERFRCARCGRVGRLDVHGNLDTESTSAIKT